MRATRRLAAAAAAAVLSVLMIAGPAQAKDTSWGGVGVSSQD